MSRPARQWKDILNSLLTQLSADRILQSCGGQPEKAFHSWRRQTATLIGTLARPEDVRTHTDGLLATIESKLKHFVSDRPGGLRERIQEIILSAIRLDCELSQQCAYWYVCYLNIDQVNRAEVEFDDTYMKVPTTHGAGQRVALMIFPALYKAGDSRGERYGQCKVVSKSEVICFSPQPPPKHYEQPAGVPQVVDSKTAMAREQYARGLQQENETSITRKILGPMGIQR